MRIAVMILLLVVSVPPNVSGGQIVVDTNLPTNNYASPFGNPFVTTIGQAFVAPRYGTGLTLDSFGFYLQGPSTETIRGYLYSWDGMEATGPAIFSGKEQALPGSGGFDLVSWDTGGVMLTPGKAYLFISSTAELSGSVGVSTMKINLAGDPMSSGIYFEQSRTDFSLIFTPNWNYAGESTAYHAVFTGTNLGWFPNRAGHA